MHIAICMDLLRAFDLIDVGTRGDRGPWLPRFRDQIFTIQINPVRPLWPPET